MSNPFTVLSQRYALRDDPRSQALSKTLADAGRAVDASGITFFRNDLRPALVALSRRVPRIRPSDLGRQKTIVEMIDVLDRLPLGALSVGKEPRTHRVSLRLMAEAWRAFAQAQADDDRGQAIFARWTEESLLLERLADEPETVYISPGRDAETGMIVYGRVPADHDFEARPLVVVLPDEILGPVDRLPDAWRRLVERGQELRAACYENLVLHDAISALRSGQPSGVIQGAKVLELDVYDECTIATHYGKPLRIDDVLDALG